MSNRVKLILVIVVLVAAVATAGMLVSGKPDPQLASNNQPVATSSTSVPSVVSPTKSVKLTEDQENAIGKARDYLEFMAFSHDGLINQMVQFDHFKRSDATFGVNSLKVNWNEQAAKKAQNYLEFTHFSREGLVTQLVHDKFTKDQAKYGAEQAFNSAD